MFIPSPFAHSNTCSESVCAWVSACVCVCGHFRPEMHSGTQCLSLSRARPRGSSSSSLFFAIATIQVQCTLQQVRAAGLLNRTHSPIAKVALATSISVRGTRRTEGAFCGENRGHSRVCITLMICAPFR